MFTLTLQILYEIIVDKELSNCANTLHYLSYTDPKILDGLQSKAAFRILQASELKCKICFTTCSLQYPDDRKILFHTAL